MESYSHYAASVYDESNRPTQYEIGGFDAEDESMDFASRVELGGNIEIGGNVEIGALALRKVVEKARDNRQPAPPMTAVDVDAPSRAVEDEWTLMDTCIGAADAGLGDFPLLAKLMQRCGAMAGGRLVRVDTEESYKAFRAGNSPELAAFHERLQDFEARLNAHARDPYAHDRLADEVEDLTWLGAEADRAAAERKLAFSVGPGYEGKHDEWLDDESVCVSLKLPAPDGSVRWVTSAEPVAPGANEAAAAAADANVPASVILGMLPAIGANLSAGTAMKEMASAAPAILARPEITSKAPFFVRVEPKSSPSLCALAALAVACKTDPRACDEWTRLASTGHPVVRRAMTEAVEVAKRAE